MTKLYKLTTSDAKTRKGYTNETQWGEGATHTADGIGSLCGPGWLHAYTHPLLAVILNPIHANFDLSSALLWECEGEIGISDKTKVGCKKLTTLRMIALPQVTHEQRIRFAILCARTVFSEPFFVAWADHWLSNVDRTAASALATTTTTASALATTTEAWAAKARAAKASAEAAWAAKASAWAAWAAEAATTSEASAWAAIASAWAAWAAEAATTSKIDLIALAKQAIDIPPQQE